MLIVSGMDDFRRSECYWAPLKLEAAESTHFLETTLLNSTQAASGSFRTRLENVNEGRETAPRVWRYLIVGIASHALRSCRRASCGWMPQAHKTHLALNTHRSLALTVLAAPRGARSGSVPLPTQGCHPLLYMAYMAPVRSP